MILLISGWYIGLKVELELYFAEKENMICSLASNFRRCIECAMSAETVFENCVPRVFLWCAFKSFIKTAYNFSKFTCHKTR